MSKTKADTLDWARARNTELQAKGNAIIRVGAGLTDAYHDGRTPTSDDLATALVRMMGLAADVMSLARQVVAACDAAIPSRDEV